MEIAILVIVLVQVVLTCLCAYLLREELRELRYALPDDADKDRTIKDLVRQVQDMSERVAMMRREGFDSNGDNKFIPSGDEPEPYSPELSSFLSAIDHPELRGYYEDQVQSLRGAGQPDEQILRTIAGEDEEWL